MITKTLLVILENVYTIDSSTKKKIIYSHIIKNAVNCKSVYFQLFAAGFSPATHVLEFQLQVPPRPLQGQPFQTHWSPAGHRKWPVIL